MYAISAQKNLMINYFPHHRMSEWVNLVVNAATDIVTKVASDVQRVREARFIVMG